MVAAALWGFAEATLFFVVPDVLLTWIVIRRGVRRALMAAVLSALGAALGGAAMVLWGASDPHGSRAAVDLVPLVGPAMIDEAATEMSQSWLLALLAGAFRGVPYKIFAQQAGVQGIDPVLFILATVAARLARFIVAVLLAAGLVKALGRIGHAGKAGWAWAGFWLAFYAGYWSVMPD
jgi:membrane protein YqaA with SNARE-associated domain